MIRPAGPRLPDTPAPRFIAARVVLGDATVAVNFVKAGAIDLLVTYLGNQLMVGRDVLEELRRLVTMRFPPLEAFVRWVEADETARLAPLSPQGILKAEDLARALRLPTDHPRTHIGECATVVIAEEMTATGVVPLVCMDDRDGKDLARRARLNVADSAELVIEMVMEGAITEAIGDRIWRRGLFPDQREAWPGFRVRLGRTGK